MLKDELMSIFAALEKYRDTSRMRELRSWCVDAAGI